jgi:hypothetical protein
MNDEQKATNSDRKAVNRKERKKVSLAKFELLKPNLSLLGYQMVKFEV